jgi:hypothetical protein
MPQDVEALETDKGVQAMIQNAYGIIITSEFNTTYKEEIAYAEYNMGNDLDNKGKLYFYGFTTQNDKLPVITCLNASKDIPVITIAEGNLSEARIEGNCINVQFNSSTNLVRLTEKIRFLFLGVINE